MIYTIGFCIVAAFIHFIVRVFIEKEFRNAKFLDETKQEDFFGQELYDESTELSN